ncbi:MAG: DUF86 domain-containing protein [Pseudomonadota bacterium]
MKYKSLEREAIFPRIDGISRNIAKLNELASLPFDKFSDGDAFDLAQHHLRMALEGVFHISTHILSRMPGGRAVEYKEIALKMGELKIVPKKFAAEKLVPMAGMRNILVHHYSDIDPKKLYDVVKNHGADIELFLGYIKEVLKTPAKFGLTIS